MKKTARILVGVLVLFAMQIPYNALAQAVPGPELRNISVSALIPPTVGDFQFDFDRGIAQVHQDQTLLYEITYGASESAGMTTTNTIIVNYSSDKAPDKSYLVEYIYGSASKGYGGAQPVIDPINRTITWEITLPEGVMNQKLTFQLHTNDSYRDPKQRVTFTNQVSMSNEYITMATISRNQDYLYDPTLVKPAPTATPAPNISPTPTVTPAPLRIYDLSFTKISESEASVSITTSNPARTIIRYGTDPANLNQTAQSTQFATYSTIDLKDLQPGTPYYLQVTVIDATGKSLRSEIYTFETTRSARQIIQSKDAYVITSGNTIVLSNILEANEDSAAFALLPTNTAYQLVYTFGIAPTLKSVDVIVRGKDGIMQRVQMTQKDSKTFIAQLRTNAEGTYNIEVLQTDDKDNLMSKRISSLKVIAPIRVLELGSNSPVLDARVLLSVFNTATGKYEPIENTLMKNPTFTDLHGEVPYILQQGKYQVDVSAFGFQSRTITFTLGPKDGENFPTILLEREGMDLFGIMKYIATRMQDAVMYMLEVVRDLSHSIRAYTAVATGVLVSTISLGFMLFHIRTEIRLRDLVPFFIFHIAAVRRKHHEEYIFGTVVDKHGKPVSAVRIEAMLATNDTVLAHTTSNRSGGFRIENDFEHPYIKIRLTNDGFPAIELIVPTDTKKAVAVRLDQKKHIQLPNIGLTHFFGGFFEVMLIVSLILEILFLEAFGVAKTMPFIVLTFFNLALWIFYQREHKLHQ